MKANKEKEIIIEVEMDDFQLDEADINFLAAIFAEHLREEKAS